jgi:hypothetical protein
MTPEPQHTWIISLALHQPMSPIALRVSQLGFVVQQQMEFAGVIVALGTDDQAEQARAIPGVADVSVDLPIDIGPPNALLS